MEYLQQIQQSYFEFFRANAQLPILIVDIADLDFLNNPADYEKILDLINRPYRPGLHRASFS